MILSTFVSLIFSSILLWFRSCAAAVDNAGKMKILMLIIELCGLDSLGREERREIIDGIHWTCGQFISRASIEEASLSF
jgi:hypothetical protein